MKENIYNNNYFFVDESGDTTFYNRKSEWIVGKENGSSKILLMGFIRTTEPQFLRKKLNELKHEILNDEYLKYIPSMKKTKIAFHAKDDCPEVRYKVFTLLKDMRYYNFLKEKFGLIVDLYDYKKGWKNFYNKKNPFDIKKISPLRLGIKILTACS